MLVAISILIFIACCLLVLAVLVQNPKGGGLASGFSAGSQVMGVRRTADFLEKATWSLAVLILVLSVVSTTINKSEGVAVDGTESPATKDKAGEMNGTPAGGGTTTPLAPMGGTNPAPPAQ